MASLSSEEPLRRHARRQNEHVTESLTLARTEVCFVAGDEDVALECDGGGEDVPILGGQPGGVRGRSVAVFAVGYDQASTHSP